MSDTWSAGGEKAGMRLANPRAALEKLYEFCDLQRVADKYPYTEVPSETKDAIDRLLPLVEEIALSLGELERVRRIAGWPYGAVDVTTRRLISIVEQRDDYQRIFGPAGPTLVASGLHPSVWNAAASLWDGGHYDSAVHAAYKAVERQTQVSISRLDLDGKALYGQAFSTKDPSSGEKRLRFPDINRTEEPKRWTSAHEAARNLGMGCAQGIRNPQAHPSPDLTEQEALEQLAALSVLARWVDECEVASAADDPDRA